MIYYTTLSSGDEAAQSLIARWATPADQSAALLRSHPMRQHDYILTRAALRALLAYVTGDTVWDISNDEDGKPHARMTDGQEIHVSISHTRGLVACAISQETPFGIDVEYWRDRDLNALAEYAYGPQEQNEVAHEGAAAFYRIWTLREAMVKADGQGLMASLDGTDRAAGALLSGAWQNPDWQFFTAQPKPYYSLAIATKNTHAAQDLSVAHISVI